MNKRLRHKERQRKNKNNKKRVKKQIKRFKKIAKKGYNEKRLLLILIDITVGKNMLNNLL